MSNEKHTLESFLREKLASEIQTFGDGTTEFHTRDLDQLLQILDDKDERIRELEEKLSPKQSVPNNSDFLYNVAVSFRHDFGLLKTSEQAFILRDLAFWIEAINKNL